MRVFRLTIEPVSSFRTPLQSDTIWGHLLWAMRYLEGEGALVDFLGRYRAGEPPLLVSAGFPSGFLPAPHLGSQPGDGEGDANTADRVVSAMLREALEEGGYLPLAQWRELAGRLSGDALRAAREEARDELRLLRRAERQHPVTHTAVDRVTGSGREAQLFVTGETFFEPGHRFDVWHKLADEADLPRLARWWQWVERNGFGRYKSAGRGAFRILGQGLVEAGGELPVTGAENGFVSLSAWVPQPDDPAEVTYRTRIKRGKLAEALALPSPWKKPLLMLVPGSVARLPRAESLREWYGGLVEEMHWTLEGIVQYGYALPLPVAIKEGA
jgi:CRISPR-associated protein Csm4